MDKQRFFNLLVLLACGLAILVIGLGVFTRLVNAGLGCPDWPGCYGHLTVPTAVASASKHSLVYPHTSLAIYKAWVEMTHRYFAAGLGLLIILIALTCLTMGLIRRDKWSLVSGILLLSLLMYQVILGMWTVTLKLLPVVVSQHLLSALILLSLLWLLYLKNREPKLLSPPSSPSKISAGMVAAIGAGLIILILQIALGAWTSSNYAALSCPGFPFCPFHPGMKSVPLGQAFNLLSPIGINYEGGVLPLMVRQTIHMSHRIGALITCFYFIGLILSIRFQEGYDHLKKLGNVILILLGIQVALGISNVWFKLPLGIALSHNLVVTLLLLSTVTLFYRAINPPNAGVTHELNPKS